MEPEKEDWVVALRARLRLATDEQLDTYLDLVLDERDRRIPSDPMIEVDQIYGHKILQPGLWAGGAVARYIDNQIFTSLANPPVITKNKP